MTRKVTVGNVLIGGGEPVVIQSMLNAPAADMEANVRQAVALRDAGCKIVRVAVPDKNAVALIVAVKEQAGVPVVADIHFDYRLALESVAAGADKVRINPGNIGGAERVKSVAAACGAKGIPIRIGVNSGSIEPELLAKYGAPCAQAMVESAANHAALLERFDFFDIVLSLKSSDLKTTIEANRLAAARFDYPLHLGVTEAGTARIGLVKSAIGIGALLAEGIGDTIRVSLCADPVQEIAAAKDILKAVGAPGCGVQIIACPTCGRTKIDVISMAQEVEQRWLGAAGIPRGCHGLRRQRTGEAREADIGIAGGDGSGVLFIRGKIVKKLPEDQLVDALVRAVEEGVV
jgi:(E)-4-hydroxy-3-methylbut-2-enyl-diphosphate synthase